MRDFFGKFERFWLIFKLRWKFRKLLSLLRETYSLGIKIFTSDPIVWDDAEPFSKIVIVFISTNLQRLRSVNLLCSHGQARDAVGLLRTMFEDLLDFMYMHQDKKRVANFIDYDSLLRLKLGRIIEKQGGVSLESLNRIRGRNAELEKEWLKVKPRFTFKGRDGKERVFSRWSGNGGVGEVAKAVGLESTHDYIWHSFSNLMHTSTLFSDQAVLGRRGNSIVVAMGASEDLLEEVMHTAISILLDMLNVVNDEHKLDFDIELQRLSTMNKKSPGEGASMK